MRIYYLISDPESVACAGGEFSSRLDFNYFDARVAGRVSCLTHKIVWSGRTPGTGRPNLVEYSEAETAAKRAEIAKEQALLAKLAQIDIERESRLQDGNVFTYMGNQFFIDFRAFVLEFASAMIDPTFTRTWKTAGKAENGVDNIYVALDKPGVLGMVSACITYTQEVWDKADTMKKEVKAIRLDPGKAVADIKNFDHTAGW